MGLFARESSRRHPFRDGERAFPAPHIGVSLDTYPRVWFCCGGKTAAVGVGLGLRVGDDKYLELAELSGKPRRSHLLGKNS